MFAYKVTMRYIWSKTTTYTFIVSANSKLRAFDLLHRYVSGENYDQLISIVAIKIKEVK
jgi:hypothetical protein